MADSGQTYKTHIRWFPLFHFVAFPITLLNLLNALRHVWMNPSRSTGFDALVAFGILAAVFGSRVMALKVQDRVIRLEMYLRMPALLPPDLQARMSELTPEQLVGLRFAGDKEMPDLVRQVLDGKLTKQTDIKRAIKDWKGDYLRA
ncbi:MAG: DUF6526 family protein [Acidimicrobiia bacterium]